ncbi:hypothetical protein HYH03_011949 [Edaphochlamys debaryana]|uniref:Uncharacterized protein n=1 Tax=Edaphochlamys debaryana TaxID=47281 RepID=A0A835XSW6_9CHLO|nr:hypothetical protein HYH03_011949 [Edaphochlamys debaryana]|eukprot:KAG2489496.1 hypothetical protein HYH03_011949 [Edaphochlamys debaryana]
MDLAAWPVVALLCAAGLACLRTILSRREASKARLSSRAGRQACLAAAAQLSHVPLSTLDTPGLAASPFGACEPAVALSPKPSADADVVNALGSACGTPASSVAGSVSSGDDELSAVLSGGSFISDDERPSSGSDGKRPSCGAIAEEPCVSPKCAVEAASVLRPALRRRGAGRTPAKSVTFSVAAPVICCPPTEEALSLLASGTPAVPFQPSATPSAQPSLAPTTAPASAAPEPTATPVPAAFLPSAAARPTAGASSWPVSHREAHARTLAAVQSGRRRVLAALEEARARHAHLGRTPEPQPSAAGPAVEEEARWQRLERCPNVPMSGCDAAILSVGYAQRNGGPTGAASSSSSSSSSAAAQRHAGPFTQPWQHANATAAAVKQEQPQPVCGLPAASLDGQALRRALAADPVRLAEMLALRS